MLKMVLPIVDLGRKGRGFQRYMWYQGKDVNPLISAERATENRRNIGHSAVLLSSGLLVTLIPGTRPFMETWVAAGRRSGAVSDRTDKRGKD